MKIILSLLLLLCINANADNFYGVEKTTWTICFTPGVSCQVMVVNAISSAKQSIDVQAYILTNPDILIGLIKAHERGVKIRVVLDKSQLNHKSQSAANYLMQHGIPVWIDQTPPIAHNKIMLIDDTTTLIGSYNFSKRANKNAENMIKITDRSVHEAYLRNIDNRIKESKKL